MADDPALLATQNRGPTVLTVTVILLSISTVVTALRLISRFGVVKRVSNDDYMIILAWLISFGFSFAICYGTGVGLGRHEENVQDGDREALRKAEYVFTVLYNPALMATKNSICLFYLTLAQNHKIFKWTTIATMVVVNVAGVILTFLNIFQCRPVAAAFQDPIQPGAKCIDIVTLFLSSAPVNIVTDLALLFLPMPILTGMKLPRNEKWILVATFSFGAFVAVVDVIRIAYLESAQVSRLDGNGSAPDMNDYSWVASLSFMWSAVEVNVGNICACVPGVKPLAAKLFPSLFRRIRKAGEMNGNNFYGPGDAQWANLKPRTHTSSQSAPRSPAPSPAPPAAPAPAAAPINGPNGGVRFEDDGNGKDEGKEMGMVDFLSAPDTNWPPTSSQTSATPTRPTRKRAASLTVFDFVNMSNPQCLVTLTNRESLGPLLIVTILFFLWGFAYGLLDILNQQFQKVFHLTESQAVGLHSAYYGAYFVAPLTFGQWIFKGKSGFKSMFITGLCVYGIGTLVFWPSGVLGSFPAFIISNFIIGLGVATLETAGNPFISLCGPPEYAEVRLNFSQGVQAIGTIISPILARKVFFKSVTDKHSLVDVQWAYLGIALFVAILALVFYYLPIPEVSNEQLERQAERRESVYRHKVVGVEIIYITLIMGVFSQFCYVGSQEAVSNFFERYVMVVQNKTDEVAFNDHAVGHTVFAVGRFMTAFLGYFIKPWRILLVLYIGCIITSALATSLNGASATAMIILVNFFESGIFSLIFAIALRGLGSFTKMGAVLLTAATSGGAFLPGIMFLVRNSYSIKYSFVVILASFAFGSIMPLYIGILPAARRQCDPGRVAKPRLSVGNQEMAQTKPKRASKVFHSVARKQKNNGGSETTASTSRPSIEHVEQSAVGPRHSARPQSGGGMDLAPWPE